MSPLPFLKELRVREGSGHDPRSLSRGIGPSDSHNLLHLGKDPLHAIRFFCNHGQIPHTLIWRQRRELALVAPMGAGVEGGAATQESTHCRAQSFWRRTGHRRARILQTQNSEWPRHLSLGFQMRSPDRLSQRRETETGAARKESESGRASFWNQPQTLAFLPQLFLEGISKTVHFSFLHPINTLHLYFSVQLNTNP